MKILIICMALTLISGCTRSQQEGKAVSGEREYDRVCIDDVEYLYSIRGYGHVMTAHMKPDNTVYTCSSK